jgi:hypothetical protein
MHKFEIPLQKRRGKMVFYVVAAVFFLFIFVLTIGAAMKNYGWWQIVLMLLFIIGAVSTAKGLIEYFLYGNVKLILESDGKNIKFYNLSSSGKKFLETKSFSLDKIGRIYGVERTTRFLYKNYSYKFEGTTRLTKIFREPIEVFPALFDASRADRDAILYFIKSLKPDIEIGYQNYLQRKMN